MIDNLERQETTADKIVNSDGISGKVKDDNFGLINECVSFVARLIERTKVATYGQVSEMLRKKYKIDSELVETIIVKGERQYLYLMSSDNILIDYKHYELVLDDRFHDKLYLNNARCKCPIPIRTSLLKEDIDMLNCLAIVSNAMPKSENFCLVHHPWTVMFTTEGEKKSDGTYTQGYLYEVVCFHENDYKAKNILIRDGFRPKEEDKKYIKRIAILDNDSYASEISRSGYENLVMVSRLGEIIMIEKREKAW